MKTRWRSRPLRQQWWQRGFTLIEMIVIVAVIGILAAVATPSFSALLDAIKVTQTVTNLQTALQDTQRQAIRNSRACTIQISKGNGNGNNGNGNNGNGNSGNGNSGNGNGNNAKKNPSIVGDCLTSGSPSLPSDVQLATNMQGAIAANASSNIAPEDLEIRFGTLGSAEFSVLSAVKPPQLPADPTGKVVASVVNPSVQKKCVAISSTLGLTRIGIYTGSTEPADITDKGVCTALDWTQQ